MRAHCVNTEDGAIWLSDVTARQQMRLDTEEVGLTVLGEYEVCLLRDACNAWLSEHARTDRGRSIPGAQPPGPKADNPEHVHIPILSGCQGEKGLRG